MGCMRIVAVVLVSFSWIDLVHSLILKSHTGSSSLFPAYRTSKAITKPTLLKAHEVQLPNVWTEFGDLAARSHAVSLGQGYPDWDPPQFVLDSLGRVGGFGNEGSVQTSWHQYTRPQGSPPLVKMLAARYSNHLLREVHPMKEVSVTVGASQALYLSMLTTLKPGDEVVLFEPFFELYLKQIKLIGAIPRFVPLGQKDVMNAADPSDRWSLDVNSLRRLYN